MRCRSCAGPPPFVDRRFRSVGDGALSMSRTVVIGGSGFIGRRLSAKLRLHGDVVNLDVRPSPDLAIPTHLMDVRNAGSFQDLLRPGDSVIVLAAEHLDNVSPTSLYHDVNVVGMRNVLAAMDRHGLHRIVFTSTVAIYGLEKDRPPREEDPPAPFNEYSESKWRAEQLLRDWAQQSADREVLVIRPTVVFGEGNRGNVFNLISQIASGRFVMVGDGTNRKSMSYVDNLVEFVRLMLQRGWSGLETFNYADTPDLDMNTLVAEVYQFRGVRAPAFRLPFHVGLAAGLLFDGLARLSGRKFTISSIRIRKFCANTVVDVSKLNSTSFRRPHSLQAGLRRMLAADFGHTAGARHD